MINKNIRKALALLLCSLITLFTFVGCTKDKGAGENGTSGTPGVIYALSENANYYEVCDYVGKDTNVIIADEIDGKVVKTIAANAFDGCFKIESVKIGCYVKEIKENAFLDCTALKSVILDNNYALKIIESRAFQNCTSLESIALPDTVTGIYHYVFRNCSSLAEITIPIHVTGIGLGAFQNCSSLTIYAEAESRPSEWDSDWNPSNRPVVWGYKE